MSNAQYENNVLTMKTVQVVPFRTAITALKDILLETNITFQPDGMRIVNMDKSHTMLVHMVLPSQNFEFFECKRNKIIVGVNMFHLFKLISQIDNDDTLTIYIENGDYSDGVVHCLSMKFENGNKKKCKTLKLNLIDPEQEELGVPDVTFSSIINLSSAEFQKTIRDFSFLSPKIGLKSVGNEIIFCGEGHWAKIELRCSEADESMQYVVKQNPGKVIQGEFSSKSLSLFIKCTNMCPQIEMYFENDLPLVIKYNVATLGEVKFGLVPLPSTST